MSFSERLAIYLQGTYILMQGRLWVILAPQRNDGCGPDPRPKNRTSK